MFRDDDPVLARVRELCLGFPNASEKVSHGRPAFFTRKVFAYFGAAHKAGETWYQHPQSVVVLAEADEREALLTDTRVFVPGYLGVSGWLGFDLSAQGPEQQWVEAAELIDASYRITARSSDVAELDRRGVD
jgi:hypothetical protein